MTVQQLMTAAKVRRDARLVLVTPHVRVTHHSAPQARASVLPSQPISQPVIFHFWFPGSSPQITGFSQLLPVSSQTSVLPLVIRHDIARFQAIRITTQDDSLNRAQRRVARRND